MADISNAVRRLRLNAQKGYTKKSSIQLSLDQIRALKKEGFSIETEKDPKAKRHGLYICIVEWTNPTVPGRKAEELLRISQNVPKNSPHV